MLVTMSSKLKINILVFSFELYFTIVKIAIKLIICNKKKVSKVSNIVVDKINFIIFYLKVILILSNLSVETTWLDIVAALLDILCKPILK